MKEKDLIRYIKHEINKTALNEVAGDMSYEQLTKILDSFKNVFRVTGVAVKSVISNIALNVDILITFDASKLDMIFKNYDRRTDAFRREYSDLLKDFEERFQSYKPILFLVNPGAYVSYEILEQNANNFRDVRDFLANTVGLDTDDIGLIPGMTAANTALARAIEKNYDPDGLRDLNNIAARQKSLQARINKILGVKEIYIRESIIKEADNKKSSAGQNLFWIFNQVIPNIEPEKFGIKKDTLKKIEDSKKKQVEEFVKILNSPIEFLENLSQAKNLNDLKESIEIIKDAPFKISGFEKISYEELDKKVKEEIEKLKKNGKLNEVMKEIDVDANATEEEKFSALKAFQLKTIIGNAFTQSNKQIAESMQKLKEEFSKKLVEDTPLDQLEKIAPGSDLEKILKEGLKKIENSGKRQAK